jgi:uncharacterized protein
MVGWVATLFPEGKPLVYRSALNERPFATQWTAAPAFTGGLIGVESYLEVDTAALGQGGSPLRQRVRLLCDAAFHPVRYSNHQAGDKLWTFDFEVEQVVVHPPGADSEQRVPRGGAEYLFGAIAHQAIAAAILHAAGRLEHAELTVFLPESLLAVPYKLSPAAELGEHWFRSSHEEDLLVDDRGVLRECRLPKKGVRTTLADPPPPLPDWAGDESLAPPRIVYAPPTGARFKLLDVSISGPVTPIGASLTIPDGPGPFPAVLFLSGSGTHDRHGIAGEIDIGTHEIMDHLAGRGFLGLRYDTRGAGTTSLGSDMLDLGLMALADDALACYRFLENRPETARDRMFLIGHSQGGLLALILKARRQVGAGGIVLLACLGRTIDQVMFDQLESQGPLMGLSPAQVAAQREELAAFIDLARSGRRSEAGVLPDHLLSLVRSRTWLRDHLENPAAELIAELPCPVLICQGAKDFQVSIERDAKPLLRAAQAAGIDVDFAGFPDLDHLFKKTEGESRMAQYYDRSRHVSPELMAVLDRWLAKRSGSVVA